MLIPPDWFCYLRRHWRSSKGDSLQAGEGWVLNHLFHIYLTLSNVRRLMKLSIVGGFGKRSFSLVLRETVVAWTEEEGIGAFIAGFMLRVYAHLKDQWARRIDWGQQAICGIKLTVIWKNMAKAFDSGEHHFIFEYWYFTISSIAFDGSLVETINSFINLSLSFM